MEKQSRQFKHLINRIESLEIKSKIDKRNYQISTEDKPPGLKDAKSPGERSH